jgi:hypothetical protein
VLLHGGSLWWWVDDEPSCSRYARRRSEPAASEIRVFPETTRSGGDGACRSRLTVAKSVDLVTETVTGFIEDDVRHAAEARVRSRTVKR